MWYEFFDNRNQNFLESDFLLWKLIATFQCESMSSFQKWIKLLTTSVFNVVVLIQLASEQSSKKLFLFSKIISFKLTS